MSSILLILAGLATSMQTYIEDWTDQARERTIPVRIFLPDNASAFPAPVVLLSHGLGGSREGFGYLGEYWADHGYVVVVMQHHGSDISLITQRKPGVRVREAMSTGTNPQAATDRVGDVRFVLDELEKRNKADGKLKGKIDMTRAGIGGHSFGSHTTFASVGRFPHTADPRLKAAILMSPNSLKNVSSEKALKDVHVPILHLTGTKDNSPMEGTLKPEDRQIPFNHLSGNQYLVVFKDGNHMLFSGHPRPLGLTSLEKKYQPMIQVITLKFLDAFVKNDPEAKKWLDDKSLSEYVGDGGTVEKR